MVLPILARPTQEFTMNRKDLIDMVAAAHPKASKDLVASIASRLFEGIAIAVQEGHRVSIFDFGTFSPKTTAARVCMNPRTGAKVSVPAKSTIRFTPTPALVQAV
jgi:nucleoid DNA-binding protein